MLNKNFKRDWDIMGGEVNLIDTSHFSLDIDKDFLGFGFDVSYTFRMVYIKIFFLVMRIY